MRFHARFDSNKLKAALERFPRQLESNIVLALKIHSRDVQNHARSHHRFTSRSGGAGLEGSVEARVDPTKLRAGVGFNTGSVRYGPFIHDGTGLHGKHRRAYKIRPKTKRALRFVKQTKFIFARVVTHPGVRPDKFIVQAAKTLQDNYRRLMEKSVNLAAKGAGF